IEIAGTLLRVSDGEAHTIASQRSNITNLASGLGVERRLVEDDRTAFALLERSCSFAVAHERRNHARRALGLVAEEIGAACVLVQGKPYGLVGSFAGPGPRRARLLALALHGVSERGDIDADAARLERVLGEIERKAVRVVKRKSSDTIEHGAALEPF